MANWSFLPEISYSRCFITEHIKFKFYFALLSQTFGSPLPFSCSLHIPRRFITLLTLVENDFAFKAQGFLVRARRKETKQGRGQKKKITFD